MKKYIYPTLKYILAGSFIMVGISHFTKTEMFMQIMPPFVPYHKFFVYFSGLAEIAGGIGVLIPQMRKPAGWGLLALLACVFPANIYMAIEKIQLKGMAPMPVWALWFRLPLQFVLAYWVWFVCLKKRT